MSEKMREEFEVWALAEAEKRSYKYMDSLLKLSPAGDGYLTTWVDCAWIGWQASREALVVDLPSMTNNGYEGFCRESEVKRVMREAGVSYK